MTDYRMDSFRLEAELSPGVWTDLTGDADLTAGIRVADGFADAAPQTVVAGAGTLMFTLDNSEDSGLLGRYSPQHANLLAGWGLNVTCRIVMSYSLGNASIYDEFLYDDATYGQEYYKGTGKVRSITPTPGTFQDRKVVVEVSDWIDDASGFKLDKRVILTSAMADEAIEILIDDMTNQPLSRDLDAGKTVMPYILDTSKDERTTVLGEVQKIVESEPGFLYVRGNSSGGGQLTFENRQSRYLAGDPLWTIGESDMVSITPTHDASMVFNVVRATIFPRDISTEDEILWEMVGTVALAPNETRVITGRFTDPNNRDVRIAAISVVVPEEGTDYNLSPTELDSGGLNSAFSLSAAVGANTADFTVTNTGEVPGVITKLRIRGKAVRLYQPLVAEARDATSIATYGERILDLQLPYLGDTIVAELLAKKVLSDYKDPKTRYSIGIQPQQTEATLIAAMAGDVGDRIEASEAITALSGEWFIHGMILQLGEDQLPYVEWLLFPAATTDYWLIEVTGRGELEQTNYLGP